MNTQTFEQYESSVRSYCRHFPAVFTKGKDAMMYDEEGNGYIDFFCGAGALNYGHNNDYIIGSMIEYLQSDGILHGMDMYTPAKIESMINEYIIGQPELVKAVADFLFYHMLLYINLYFL